MLRVGQQDRPSADSGSASECFWSPLLGTHQEEVAVSIDRTSLDHSQIDLRLDDLAMDGRDQGQLHLDTRRQPTLFADGLLISCDPGFFKPLQQLLNSRPAFGGITIKHLNPTQTQPSDLLQTLRSIAEPESGLPLIIFLDHADQNPDLTAQINRLLRPRMRLVMVAIVDDADAESINRLYEAGVTSVVRRPMPSTQDSGGSKTDGSMTTAAGELSKVEVSEAKAIEAWWEQLAGYWLATQGIDRTAGAKGVGV